MPITVVGAAKGPGTFPGSANNTSTCVINKPSGTVDDDFMLAFFVTGFGVTVSQPGGWSLLAAVDNGSNLKTVVYYKVAASEGASYSFTDDSGSTTPFCGGIVTYRGVNTSSPINNHNTATTTTGDPVTTPSVTTTERCLMAHIAFSRTTTVASQGTYVNGSGQTMREDPANRGASTQYFSELSSSTADTVVAPGSQAGTTFDANHTVTNGIQWQIGLREFVAPVNAPATVAPVTVAAYPPASLTVTTTSGFSAATVTAYDAQGLPGKEVVLSSPVAATVTAYDAMGWVIHPVNVGAIAFDATVAITTDAAHAPVSVGVGAGVGYFGAPASRTWRIAAENRSYTIAAESRVYRIPSED